MTDALVASGCEWVEVERGANRMVLESRRRSLLNKARKLRIATSSRVVADGDEWVLRLFLTPTSKEMLL